MMEKTGHYDQMLEWMYRQIPMYQRQGGEAYKADLSATEALDAYMGHPHRFFRTIHVGGTNGKGSVAHMLASVLQSAGYRTGLYTSPHLRDFRERIRVDGRMVEKDFVVSFIEQHQQHFLQIQPSFFEMTVAMAFEYFRHAAVDVAVVEVGLGGRLDSTNIIDPDLSVITNISLDHTQFLGNTVEEIAREKAGIIKQNTPTVVGEFDTRTAQIFRDKAAHEHAGLSFADQDYRISREDQGPAELPCYTVSDGQEVIYSHLCTDLLGVYQSKNLLTAIRALEELKKLGYRLDAEAIRRGLSDVGGITGFKGRWFVLQHQPLIICDTAHNEAGLKINIQQAQRMNRGRLHFVLGFVNDKQLDAILELFPQAATYYFTKADIPRALQEDELAKAAASFGLTGQSYPKAGEALEAARSKAEKDDLIYVGGSTFLVSELIGPIDRSH